MKRAVNRRIVEMLIFLQFWGPVLSTAKADDVVKNAGQGQVLANELLRSQVGTLKNTTVINQHGTAANGTNAANGQATFNLKDFGLGGDAAAAMKTLRDIYASPETLTDFGKQARRDIQERGCPSTSFVLDGTRAVLKVTPLVRTLNDQGNGVVEQQDTPDATYSGQVNLRYPTIGYVKSWYQVVTEPRIGAPGLVLFYEATPFTVPNDGTFVTYNHSVLGSAGSPVVVDYGNRGNGYATETLAYANGGPIQVSADLYKVVKNFTPQPAGGCLPDPPSCIVSGLNFCSSPGLGVLDAFKVGQNNKSTAMATFMSAVSAVQYDESDAGFASIVNRGAQVLNGTDPIFTELFSGCTESANFSTNTIQVHKEAIRTCSMPMVDLPLTCNGQRGTHFVHLQESTVLTATFYKRIQVPIIDPNTGLQAKDSFGVLLYSEQDIPTKFTGAVNIGTATFGGGKTWRTEPDANGYFVEFTSSPFSVPSNEYFPYAVSVASDGSASAAISSYGNKSDNWAVVGSASVSNAAQLRVNAQLYQVVNNTIVGCEDYLKHAADGFCKPEMQCTEMKPSCITLDGVSFCDGSGPSAGVAELLAPWGVNDSAQAAGQFGNGQVGGGAKTFLPRMCWAGVGAKMDCKGGYTGAANCYTDINGAQQCGTATGEGLSDTFGQAPKYLDDCSAPNKNLASNPSCRLVSTNTCTEGAAGLFSGDCYNRTVVYDCGTDSDLVVPGGVSYAKSCSSPIRCMGTECHNPKGEINVDFGKAIASTSIIDMAARDLVCAEDGQKPTSVAQASCTPLIFNGENTTCKIPIGNNVGLTPNCCEQSEAAAANAPDAIKYIQLAFYTYRMSTDKLLLTSLAKVPGLNGFSSSMYSTAGELKGAIDGAITSTKSFLADSASTAASKLGFEVSSPAATNTAKEFVLDEAGTAAGLTQAQLASYNQFLTDHGMSDLAGELFVENGGEIALSETGEQMFQALEGLQTAFMVYSIAKIIGHIVFKCEKSELELGVQKKQRNCHYVGNYCSKSAFNIGCIENKESYCCYKTPLARIVAEQIRTKSPSVAGGFGNPSAPSCGGFTPVQLAAFDWSQFDPSEWVSLLQEAGLVPNSTNAADTMYGLTSSRATTETGSPVANQVNIQEQTIKRYAPLVETYNQRRAELAQKPVCYGDSKQMPWYQPTIKPENIVRALGGTGAVASCGDGCMDVYLGRVGDNYIVDQCSQVFRQDFNIAVDMPEYIQSAHLMEAQWDDHIQIAIGGDVVYQSPGFGNPPAVCELGAGWCIGQKTAGGKCTAVPSNDPGGPVDVTAIFKRGGNISTATNAWIGGNGEAFARVRVLYNVPPPAQAGDCISPSGAD